MANTETPSSSFDFDLEAFRHQLQGVPPHRRPGFLDSLYARYAQASKVDHVAAGARGKLLELFLEFDPSDKQRSERHTRFEHHIPKLCGVPRVLFEWQRAAASVLLTGRNPRVAFDVLKRTLETATTDMTLHSLEESQPDEDILVADSFAQAFGSASDTSKKEEEPPATPSPEMGKLGQVQMQLRTLIDELETRAYQDERTLDQMIPIIAQVTAVLATISPAPVVSPSEEEPQQMDLAALLALLQGRRPVRDMKNEPRIEAFGGNFKVVIPEAGLTCDSVKGTAHALDTQFLVERLEDFMLPEYIAVENVGEKATALGQILYQHFGLGMLDLSLALVIYGWINDEERRPEDREMLKKIDLNRVPVDLKRKFLEDMIKSAGRLSEDAVPIVLRWALGPSFYEKITQGEDAVPCSTGEVMNKTRTLLSTKEKLRGEMLEALSRLTRAPDQLLASAFVRQGWRTLMEVGEVTDWEWLHHLKRIADEEFTDDDLAQWGSTDGDLEKKRARALKRQQDLRGKLDGMLATLGDAPPEIRRLSSLIDCERYRRELTALRQSQNPVGVAAKQLEIVDRVFGHVTRFVSQSVAQRPSYEVGLPAFVSREKKATCFSGPWLIAMMLFLCGLEYEELAYCHVKQTHDGVNGSHGSIIVKTEMGELTLIDHGYHIPARDILAPLRLLLAFCPKKTKGHPVPEHREEEDGVGNEVDLLAAVAEAAPRTLDALQTFFMSSRKDDEGKKGNTIQRSPVVIRLPRAFGFLTKVHPFMTVMGLKEGFESGHLLHVGITFFNERRWEEAKYAFELALKANPQDTDILYYLGMLAFEKNNLKEARTYFDQAVTSFPEHARSLFGLGELAIAENDATRARAHFRAVAEIKSRLYGGNEIIERAKELVEMPDEALLKAGRFPY